MNKRKFENKIFRIKELSIETLDQNHQIHHHVRCIKLFENGTKQTGVYIYSKSHLRYHDTQNGP